jgi:hypothetical protein
MPQDKESALTLPQFEQRWAQLTHPHVRALAWLLDAPNLLDAGAPEWGGHIGILPALSDRDIAWLHALDRDPTALDAALGARPHTRLGLYAEQLIAFYFRAQGRLVAHGLQVRAHHNNTIGEFDFLLSNGSGGLAHWELATKFYLLDPLASTDPFDTFVGPNRVDSLGAKMRKVIDKQLSLASHPAAASLLPGKVEQALALVKGWLFYPAGHEQLMPGIAPDHCRGFWCTFDGFEGGGNFVVLPRMQWFAPYKSGSAAQVMDAAQLHRWLADFFVQASAPALVAEVIEVNGMVVETRRGFVVPNQWQTMTLSKH